MKLLNLISIGMRCIVSDTEILFLSGCTLEGGALCLSNLVIAKELLHHLCPSLSLGGIQVSSIYNTRCKRFNFKASQA